MANVCVACFQELSKLENIFVCARKHHYCAPCAKNLHLLCECNESLQLLTLKNAEESSSSGIECLGNLLRVWECQWTGIKNEFSEHFIRCHNQIEIFSQFQTSSVPFQDDQFLSATTLIRAFDCNFIFYYHTNPTLKMIYFLIFLLDDHRQPKPESFLYELMIKSPKENHCKYFSIPFWPTHTPSVNRQIKFVEKCFVLSDDVKQLIDNERCAALTFKSIEKHFMDGRIHFSFLIKKNCKESLDVKKPPDVEKKQNVVPHKISHSFPNKGIMKSNTNRKNPSVPDVKLTGGGVLKKDLALPEVDIVPSISATPVTKESPIKCNPPDYASISCSSINKKNNHNFTSPACTSAINRSNDELLLDTGTMRTDECYHFPNMSSQPYKIRDHKMYRQKYPDSCLSKPILRK